MTPAIGYIRCSTHEQADSGLGLKAQDERIRAYCTLKGLRLTEIVQDAGVSGGKPLASREGVSAYFTRSAASEPRPWSCSSSTVGSATQPTV